MDFMGALQRERRIEMQFLKAYERGIETEAKYRLTVKKRKNGRREYYARKAGSRKEIYIGKGEEKYLRQLQRQRLCLEGKKVLERNLEVLDRLLEIYQSFDPSSLEKRLPESYRTVEPDSMEDGPRFTQSENPYHREHLIHTTSFGLVVRSRIEAAIAELAHAKGFFIMYEKKVTLYGADGYAVTVYTDFILARREDAPEDEWIYWEHLGMLDFSEYRERALKKIELYYRNGILPGKNLVLTADSPGGAIDMESINRILDSFMQMSA